MICALLVGLVLQTKGYYIALVYLSAALAFFLLRTLKLRIEPEVIEASILKPGVNLIFWFFPKPFQIDLIQFTIN